MPVLEGAIAKLGGAVVSTAASVWLSERSLRKERTSSLAELIELRVTDKFMRKDLKRQLEGIVDEVVRRLEPYESALADDLKPNERGASILLVTGYIQQANLSDEELFATDMDAVRLARTLRERALYVKQSAGLSGAGERYFDLVLAEACECLIRIVLQLRAFPSRALAESLGRLSMIGDSVSTVLRRLPARTLEAPAGSEFDMEFRQRYLELVSNTLDRLELFGVELVHQTQSVMSVAYLSLCVLPDTQESRESEPAHDPFLDGEQPTAAGLIRVEEAVVRNPRILIRGEAGSGKTTLLKWIAVNAARGSFAEGLEQCNGYVPFLISLRSIAAQLPSPKDLIGHAAPMLDSIAPSAWAFRQLSSKKCFVLIDGVDEVPAQKRDAVRLWLTEMTIAFPNARYIITTRPAAAGADWLGELAFIPLKLQPMNLADTKHLIARWHEAAAVSSNLPVDVSELPDLQNRLTIRLESNLRLRLLATTPLICAMLCALNLDHRGHLPRNRMELYESTLRMLFHRRDLERGIVELSDGLRDVQLKRVLLRDLAWRMSMREAAEVDFSKAADWLERRASAFRTTAPQIPVHGKQLLTGLLERSGILREPVPGRVSFIHRTFLEYLAAEEAAEEDQIDYLVKHAHHDSWQEITSLAAGHANGPLRRELLTGLLKRAEASRKPGTLQVASVLVRCSETAVDIPDDLQRRLDYQIDRFVPPQSALDARLLASGGEPVLQRLHKDTSILPEWAASATVIAAAIVNGEDALELLAGYGNDSRRSVCAALFDVWALFDADEFAHRVLRPDIRVDGYIEVTRPAQARAAVKRFGRSAIRLIADEAAFRSLDEYPPISALSVYGHVHDLIPLQFQPDLQLIQFSDVSDIVDFSPLGLLGDLKELHLYRARQLVSLRHLEQAKQLRRLVVHGMPTLNVRPLHDRPIEIVIDRSQPVVDGVDFGQARIIREKVSKWREQMTYPKYF